MRQTNWISPILEILSNELNILPAVGGAVEDLEHPDADELEDMLINGETKDVTDFQETPTPDIHNLYRPTQPIFRKDNHFYRFFIDGSLRSYFLATGQEANRTFPIEMAQIGAAVIIRDDSGDVQTHKVVHKILLLLPKGQFGVSDTVWRNIKNCEMQNGLLEVIDTTEKNVNTPQDAAPENLRNRAGGIARNRMHKLEIDVISATDDIRNDQNWVIIDGAVKLDEFVKTKNLIGVAKNFQKNPVFHFGRSNPVKKDITTLIAGLPYAHRTVAFSSYNGKVAFWYIRLRDQGEVDYPLMGVVKVEYPCPDQNPIPSDLADLISKALIAERNVTPHGADKRWHCHLYPIYQAEQAIKNKFYSRDILMGMIKWPNPKLH